MPLPLRFNAGCEFPCGVTVAECVDEAAHRRFAAQFFGWRCGRVAYRLYQERCNNIYGREWVCLQDCGL